MPSALVLWQGAPDAHQALRTWFRGRIWRTMLGVGGVVAALAFQLWGKDFVIVGPLRTVLPWIIGLVVAVWLSSLASQGMGIIRRARSTRYTLTAENLVIEDRQGRREMRLPNLSDLQLQPDADGYATIYFSPPLGDPRVQLLERVTGPLAQFRPSVPLLGPILGAQGVFDLLRSTQAAVPLAHGPTGAGEPHSRIESLLGAPVARQSIMGTFATMPIWVGASSLTSGLAVLALGASRIGSDPAAWIVLVVGLPFTLTGSLIVAAGYQAISNARRLRSHGTRSTGQVVEVAEAGVRINYAPQWVVRYSFGSGAHTGQSAMMPWVKAAHYAAGDNVAVIYDPDDPTRSTLADEQ